MDTQIILKKIEQNNKDILEETKRIKKDLQSWRQASNQNNALECN